MANQKNSSEESGNSGAALVKVSMDGAPYLRKVDLKMYKSYQELSDALAKMFSSFTMGKHTCSFSSYACVIIIMYMNVEIYWFWVFFKR